MSHKQNFVCIKIKLAYTFILVAHILLLPLTGCRKDIGQDAQTNDSKAVYDRSEINPSVINGMLHFNSFTELDGFTKLLQYEESDSTQIRNAYIALGVDVNAEYLPNLTDYPTCLLKEQVIGGYTSARKLEENAINAALNSGDDNVFSIISDPFRKTALNADYSVKVGNRIYKFYPSGGIAIVLNNDWALYNAIKLSNWEVLPPSYNLIITHRESSDYQDFFTFEPNGNISGEKKVFRPAFQSKIDSDGKLKIVNYSAISSTGNNLTFTWNYSDQTNSIGVNPNRTVSDGEVITVTISNGAGDAQTMSPLACNVENFAITNLGNNNFKFGPGFDPANSPYYTKWVFNDGTVVQATTTTKTFTSNGWVRCEAWRTSNNTKACEFTKNVIVKCGDEKEKTATVTSTNWGGSGKHIKIDATLWVKNGEVGCKSKHLAKKFGIWLPLNLAYTSNGACTDISGSYFHDPGCITKTVNQEKCLQPGQSNGSITLTIADPGPNFANPGALSSGHRLRFLPGTWFGFGYGGGPARLTLN